MHVIRDRQALNIRFICLSAVSPDGEVVSYRRDVLGDATAVARDLIAVKVGVFVMDIPIFSWINPFN